MQSKNVHNMECAEYGMCKTWNVQNIEVANVDEIECAQFQMSKNWNLLNFKCTKY